MFGDVVRPSVRLGSRSWYTVSLSIAAHVAIAAIVIVVPLMATDVLPTPSAALASFVAPPPPPVPPPPPAAQSPTQKQMTVAPVNQALAPVQPPDQIREESPLPSVPLTTPGVSEGFPTGVPGGTGTVTPIPPLPPPPAAPEPVRPGGKVKHPTKTKDVRPVYPTIAQSNRVEGRVIIEAIIGVDGRVRDARVLRSIPLLDRAALDAVMQWQFTPTLLNGVPVPVIMTVTVNFTLQQPDPFEALAGG
jgi:protein TonB